MPPLFPMRFLLLLLLTLPALASGACSQLASWSCETEQGGFCIVIGAPEQWECDTLTEASSKCEAAKTGAPGTFEQCAVGGSGEGAFSTATVYLQVIGGNAAYVRGYYFVDIEDPEAPAPEVTALDCGQPPACQSSDPSMCAIALQAYEARCAVTGRDEVVSNVENCDAPLECTASPVNCAQLEAAKALRCESKTANIEQGRALQRISAYLADGAASSDRAAAVYAQSAQNIVNALAPLNAECPSPPCEGEGSGEVDAINAMSDRLADSLLQVRNATDNVQAAVSSSSERERQDLHNALALDGIPEGDLSGTGEDAYSTEPEFTGFDQSGFGWSSACPLPASPLGASWSAGDLERFCTLGSGIGLLFIALAAFWSLQTVLRD